MKPQTKEILNKHSENANKKVQKMLYLPEKLLNELKVILGKDGNVSGVVTDLLQGFIDDAKGKK